MKLSEFKKLKVKKPKYNNSKVEGYDSAKEYKRSKELKNLERIGAIKNLREQVTYSLLPAQYVLGYNGKQICGRRERKYIADFVYDIGTETIVEDSKGFRTAEYKSKKILMKRILNIQIKET